MVHNAIVVIESPAWMKTKSTFANLLDQGVKRVWWYSARKKKNVRAKTLSMGVQRSKITTKSATSMSPPHHAPTNCLYPVVKVARSIGIKHGSMTTIPQYHNTQTIIDART